MVVVHGGVRSCVIYVVRTRIVSCGDMEVWKGIHVSSYQVQWSSPTRQNHFRSCIQSSQAKKDNSGQRKRVKRKWCYKMKTILKINIKRTLIYMRRFIKRESMWVSRSTYLSRSDCPTHVLLKWADPSCGVTKRRVRMCPPRVTQLLDQSALDKHF
jgi:hypothetical protein